MLSVFQVRELKTNKVSAERDNARRQWNNSIIWQVSEQLNSPTLVFAANIGRSPPCTRFGAIASNNS